MIKKLVIILISAALFLCGCTKVTEEDAEALPADRNVI